MKCIKAYSYQEYIKRERELLENGWEICGLGNKNVQLRKKKKVFTHYVRLYQMY